MNDNILLYVAEFVEIVDEMNKFWWSVCVLFVRQGKTRHQSFYELDSVLAEAVAVHRPILQIQVRQNSTIT